ncbi:MAG: hypothetical protein MI923_03110 [Phycisphaerales bacterium]|nr:hypothetical protein [Phycisphaerales bacterium]
MRPYVCTILIIGAMLAGSEKSIADDPKSKTQRIDHQIDGDTTIKGEVVLTSVGKIIIDYSITTTERNKRVSVWIALLDKNRRIVFKPWGSPQNHTVSTGRSLDRHFEHNINSNDVSRVDMIHTTAFRSDLFQGGKFENYPLKIDETAGSTHVIVIPGLTGSSRHLEKATELIENYRLAPSDITVQIWDWWQFADRKGIAERVQERYWPDGRPTLGLQAYLAISDVTRTMAKRLADQLAAWKRPSRTKRLYLVSLSAGTNIAAELGKNSTVPKDLFDKCIFISGVLSKEGNLDPTARISKSIYNHYSHRDELLTTSKYYVNLFVIFRIRIDANITWPASGRFPFAPGDPGYFHVTSQLGFLSESDMGTSSDVDNLGNKGTHLDPGALTPKYFETMLLPLFQEDDNLLPKYNPARPRRDGWNKPPHPTYTQEGWDRMSNP